MISTSAIIGVFFLAFMLAAVLILPVVAMRHVRSVAAISGEIRGA